MRARRGGRGGLFLEGEGDRCLWRVGMLGMHRGRYKTAIEYD